jgi:hypothetical protein
MADEQPKIFIDEDWKAQVQREREEAARKAAEAPGEGTEEKPGAAGPRATEEVTFASLLDHLGLQAAFSLGLVAGPDSKKVMVSLPEAKYMIDMLLTLRTKTKGNLMPEEEGTLTETIAELQRAYVVRAQQVQEAHLKQAGITLKDPGGK